MQKSERKRSVEFKRYIEDLHEVSRRGGTVRQIVGDMFTKGLPDRLVVLPSGRIVLAELKIGNPQTVGALFKRLRDPKGPWHESQRRFIYEMGRIDADVFVVCANATEERWACVRASTFAESALEDVVDDTRLLYYSPLQDVVSRMEASSERRWKK